MCMSVYRNEPSLGGCTATPPRQPKNYFDLKSATMGKKNSFKKTWWRRFVPSNKGGQSGQHIGQDENGQKQDIQIPGTNLTKKLPSKPPNNPRERRTKVTSCEQTLR